MVTKVIYNNKSFKILDSYNYTFSNNEVTYSDIKIDFNNRTLADIPYKYQEIKIVQADTEENILNGTVMFTGYLEDIDLSDIKTKDDDREITLTLLSPLKMATKRNVSLIGTYQLKTAIQRVLQPLIDDGFILKELNVPDSQITVNYILETIEYEMNDIGAKRNIFWFINEKKEIFVNSIDYLFGLPVKKIINQNIEEEGFLKAKPELENTDYANVINFKNVRLYYNENDYIGNDNSVITGEYPIINLPRTLKKGDIVNFNNPIIIDEKTLRSIGDIEQLKVTKCLGLIIEGTGIYENVSIGITKDRTDINYNTYVEQGNFSYIDSEGEENKIVLQKDNLFSNMITGFKWNGNDGAYIKNIETATALRYTTMRFVHSPEINKLKGIISKTGQIEKTVDYNSKWTTLSELVNYARSLMVQNSNIINKVILAYEVNPDLVIGDIVEFDMPDFYIQGKFAVKEIKYNYNNDLDKLWQITLKNTELISSYIDIFRPIEKEENSNTIDTVIISEFIEEQIKETHLLEIDSETHTLDFNL